MEIFVQPQVYIKLNRGNVILGGLDFRQAARTPTIKVLFERKIIKNPHEPNLFKSKCLRKSLTSLDLKNFEHQAKEDLFHKKSYIVL